MKAVLLSLMLTCFCNFALAATPLKSDPVPLKPWQIIPPTPNLPKPLHSGYVKVDQAKIWYAEYGKGQPVILLHGGLTSSDYWGALIPVLQKSYRVIIIDSRGHGRSTLGDQPISYHTMAEDVVAVMQFLELSPTAIVGWSDGANIGLDIAINHPKKLSKLFALAGNSNPNATMDISHTPAFDEFAQRVEQEYLSLSPTPSAEHFKQLSKQVANMWEAEPVFTEKMLQNISVPTWIVIGDHDESIKRSDAEFMAKTIPDAGLLIEPNAGHFVFLQHPEKFNDDVLNFLKF